jgi:hypothetical protein
MCIGPNNNFAMFKEELLNAALKSCGNLRWLIKLGQYYKTETPDENVND